MNSSNDRNGSNDLNNRDDCNNILLINQDKVFLDYVIGILVPSGYTIHCASDMRGALAALSHYPVGLIVCGKDLQDISGCDFLRFIKSDPLRENIPLMFLVSIKNQGHPFKAFELGAMDYLVYPVAPEILISRIEEAFKQAPAKEQAFKKTDRPEQVQCAPREKRLQENKAQENKPQEKKAQGNTLLEKKTPENKNQENKASEEKSPEEKPQNTEKSLPDLKIDVSRDGVIWLAATVKRFHRQGLFMETSLFGKPGVRLLLRFKLSDGMYVANSLIKEMSFDDFQKPTGITVAVEDDGSWRRIHADLEKAAGSATHMPQGGKAVEHASGKPANKMAGQSDGNTAPADSDVQKTIIAAQPAADSQEISGTQLIESAEKKKSNYDIRFYYSLIGKQMDNYRAISLIGAGSMGGVLQGWDVALEREVALKIISYELSSKQKFRDMFIKEARVVSRLNHQNIAQIYSIGSSNEILYYAMEFIDGETLKAVINREGTLNSLKGLEYLLTICEALEFVYRSSVVHRDIKPANIMINNLGVIKLLDFGVANVCDAKTSGLDKNLIMGTPLYMSPEQIAGLALDHRSDMYSLGATFYHAFCGSPPFESGDFKEILDQHLSTPLVPLKDKNPKTAPALCKIIEKMLAKDPNDRFKDFQTIVTELKSLRSRVVEPKRMN